MVFTVKAGTFGGLIDPLELRAFDAPLLPASEPEGSAGGGTPENAPEPAAGDEPAAAGEPAARVAAGDDDDDDADDDDPDLKDDGRPVDSERFKRVTAKLNKLNRRARRMQPVAARLKELKEAGFSLDDLVVKARNHDMLEQTIRSNPRLARAIYGGDDAEDEAPRPAKGRAAPPADPDFDESTLPFDPNESPINRYFADLAKQNHELNRTVRQLAGRVDQVDGRDHGRVLREEKTQWKSAIDGAAGHIKDEGVQTLFKDAVSAAFADRKNHKLSAQQIVSHYLKVLKVDPAQAAKANTAAAAAGTKPGVAPAASAQRIAERNQTLPRNVAPQGTPAPARATRETLADVHKRLRSSVGA